MIDIHAHVLPGVDDGATTEEDALAMCRRAAEDGCRVLFATPHLRHPLWPDQDPAALSRGLEALVRQVRDVIDLRLGAEVRLDEELAADPGALLERGALLTLAGSRYLLLEPPRIGPAPELEDAVHELRVLGLRPILAHPELVEGLAGQTERLADLVAAGALAQVTAGSLTGEWGRRARRWAWEWVEAGLAHFVASDAHGAERRPPGLSAVRRELERRIGPEGARRLTEIHPACILTDRELAEAL